MQELNWRLYCVALHYIPAILIRWEGLGTRSVPPLFVRHSSHTPIVTYLPWMTISNANMLFCNMHCISEMISVFFPLLIKFSLHGRVPAWIETHWTWNFDAEENICNLASTEAPTSSRQWAGVWGKTPFSTGESSQFCKIHNIPESVELGKQLVSVPG